MSSRRITCALLASSALGFVMTSPAAAQFADPAPVRQSIDANGVDLFAGTLNIAGPALSVGPTGDGLTFTRLWRDTGWSDTLIATLTRSGNTFTAGLGAVSDSFTLVSGGYAPTEGNGATLTFDAAANLYTYTSGDATVIVFDKALASTQSYNNEGLARSVTRASGEKLTYTYRTAEYCVQYVPYEPGTCQIYGEATRLAQVRNAFGYAMTLDYARDSMIRMPDVSAWSTPIAVYTANLAAGGVPAGGWPSQSFASATSGGVRTDTITAALGRGAQFTVSGGKIVAIRRGGSTTNDVTIAYDGTRVGGVTTAAGTTTYATADTADRRTVTVTDPAAFVTSYVFDLATRRMLSMTTPNAATTAWGYDASGRVTTITQPEGNAVRLVYDARGNVTERHATAKPGSALPEIVTRASYAAACGNVATCNQPVTTTDARGNVTEYTYDAVHGGVTSVTSPAVPLPDGKPDTRAQTRYAYAAYQAYFRDAGGAINPSGEPVYRLTQVSACQESSACTGQGNEARTTIGYGPQVAGTGNTLLPVAVARGSGDGVATPVATTAYGYDAIGNLTSVDGPRSGTADVATYRYDGARRAVGAVSADPDGAGPLKPRAVRTTYDAKDRATLVEQGNVASASDADWAGFAALQSVARDYDGIDRPVKETLVAGGTTYGVSQYGYFADGPLECATQRMNPDTWDAPGPVCDAGADGAYGRDRVVRLFRNPSGQVVRRRVGIGSDASLSDQTVGYTLNGQIVRVTDGELDRTTFVYDGFDRLIRTRYPVATVGADTSATSDDEQVVYDASGNVVTLIQRDDVTTTFTYDALGRRMREDIAGSDPDIDYRYDLLGRLRSATAPGQPGRAYAYDARGNVTIHSGPYGYRVDTYDVADRRVRRTWSDDTNQVPPDAFFVTYDYLETGEVTAIREAGAPVLASFGYDALGRRVRVGRGDGSVTTYGYDAGSRLTALAHDLTGTANDVRYTFAYNPAGQIVSETRDNDAYAWTGHGNTDRAESVDGLNRVTQAGPNAATYDARGNTTAIGGMMYGYDRRNRLQQAGTGYLYYDTLGDLTTTVAAGVTRLYEKEPDGSIAIERDGNGATLRRYITAPGETEPVMWYDGPGLNGTGAFNRRWAYADPRGSIVAVADESGGVTINRYDAYGVPAAGNTGAFGYTGQLWLPWAGLYHYQARAYNPAIGRFLQTDPIGLAGGMNLYGYVAGDPVNGTDPSGLCRVSTGKSNLRNECVVRIEPADDIVVEARPLKRECTPANRRPAFLSAIRGLGPVPVPDPEMQGRAAQGRMISLLRRGGLLML